LASLSDHNPYSGARRSLSNFTARQSAKLFVRRIGRPAHGARLSNNMNVTDVISKVARMPLDFYSSGDASMVSLLRATGYLGAREQITRDALTHYFETDGDALIGWVRLSQDNRGTPAWYLLEPQPSKGDDVWVVGHHPSGDRLSFASGAEACADFCVRWINAAADRLGSSG
jgi:hypothetical protein